MSNKEPWLAVNFSTFFPGIGQLYCGRKFKGYLLIFIYTAILIFASHEILAADGNVLVGIAFFGFAFGLWLWNLFDAFQVAKSHNSDKFETQRIQQKDPWLAMLLSQLLLGCGNFYLNKWLIGLIGVAAIISSSYFLPIISPLILGIVTFSSYMMAPVRRDRTIRRAILVASLIVLTSWLFLGIQFLVSNIYEARWIPSGAMAPTLKGSVNPWQADRVIINKWLYRTQPPKRGDIVVFQPNETLRNQGFGDTFIQRIVALPGEKVELRAGKVYVNDKLLPENQYLDANQQTQIDVCNVTGDSAYLFQSVTIPNNYYLSLGDNRNASYDGRCWGVIPRANLIGKAYKRYFPFDRIGSLEIGSGTSASLTSSEVEMLNVQEEREQRDGGEKENNK